MTIIERLRALEAKATKGPWEFCLPINDAPDVHARWGRVHKYEVRDGVLERDIDIVEVAEHDEHDDDLRLIAAARNALPLLLDVAEAMSKHEGFRGWSREAMVKYGKKDDLAVYDALSRLAELEVPDAD